MGRRRRRKAGPKVKKKGSGLTPRAKAFIAQYVIDRNGVRAAIAAGYSPRSAGLIAARLLDPEYSPIVAKTIQEELDRINQNALMTADDIRLYIHSILRLCPGDYFLPGENGNWCISMENYRALPRGVRCLIEHMELQSVELPDGSRRDMLHVQFISKRVALVLAAKYALTEKHRHDFHIIDWDKLLSEVPKSEVPDKIEQELDKINQMIEVKGRTLPPLTPENHGGGSTGNGECRAATEQSVNRGPSIDLES